MKTYFTFVFLFCTCFSFAQSLSGTLVDKNTNETIPFATVQIGEDYGVVTNMEGVFSINTKAFQPTDSLVFSFMGYDRRAIAIKDFEEGNIYLEKNVEELSEVLLMNRELTATEVMEKVNANLEENYDNSLTHFTVFKREKNITTPYQTLIEFKNKRKDYLDKKTIREINHAIDSFSRAVEGKTSSFYNSELAEVYFGKEDSVKIQMIKATKLVNEEESTSLENLKDNVFMTFLKRLGTSNTFQVRTGIIPISDSLDMNEIIAEEEEIDSILSASSRDNYTYQLGDFGFNDKETLGFVTSLKDYEYTIEDVSTFNNELVYVVSFKPDEGLFAGNGILTGTMYISTDDFAVLMADFKYAEGGGSKINLKFVLGFAFEKKENSGKIIFQKNAHGKYIPKYIKKHRKGYIYFERYFVFKENYENKNDRMKVKFELTLELDQGYTTEWLIVQTEDITKSEFDAIEENEGIVVEKVSEFDPEIWKDYNILAPTKAIKNYEY